MTAVAPDKLRSKAPLRGPVVDVLRTLLGDHGERDTVLSIVGELVARNAELERRVERLASRYKPTERVSQAQLVLFLDELKRRQAAPPDAAAETDPHAQLLTADDELRVASGIDEGEDDTADNLRTPAPRRQPRAPTPPAHHRRVDNPIAVPAGQRTCPTCGAERVCLAPHVTEVIELVPAEVVVRRDLREQLACATCDGPAVRAPAGQTVVPNGKLGLGLVAAILIDKYLDGLPLHRQRDRYRRLGLELAVSTLADQVEWCTDLLRPLWHAALAAIIDARVMHLDGTGLPVQDSDAPGGKRLGALWGYVGVNADEVLAAYLYVSSGKKTGQRPNERGPEDILALRTGLTVADASSLFDASFARAELIECGCNMHYLEFGVIQIARGILVERCRRPRKIIYGTPPRPRTLGETAHSYDRRLARRAAACAASRPASNRVDSDMPSTHRDLERSQASLASAPSRWHGGCAAALDNDELQIMRIMSCSA